MKRFGWIVNCVIAGLFGQLLARLFLADPAPSVRKDAVFAQSADAKAEKERQAFEKLIGPAVSTYFEPEKCDFTVPFFEKPTIDSNTYEDDAGAKIVTRRAIAIAENAIFKAECSETPFSMDEVKSMLGIIHRHGGWTDVAIDVLNAKTAEMRIKNRIEGVAVVGITRVRIGRNSTLTQQIFTRTPDVERPETERLFFEAAQEVLDQYIAISDGVGFEDQALTVKHTDFPTDTYLAGSEYQTHKAVADRIMVRRKGNGGFGEYFWIPATDVRNR